MSKSGKGKAAAARPPVRESSVLAHTLHDAETAQLNEFLKSRNRAVDQEIEQMRKRLGASGALGGGGGGGSGGELDDDGGGRGSSSFLRNFQGSIQGRNFTGGGGGGGGGGGNMYPDEDSQTSRNMAFSQSFGGRGAAAGEEEVGGFVAALSGSPAPRAAGMRDKLGSILSRIKIKMEDVQMSKAELRDLLLPGDLSLPSDAHVSIAELTSVLQTDLVMPVTRDDQVFHTSNAHSHTQAHFQLFYCCTQIANNITITVTKTLFTNKFR